jgi:NitT/TauT family transport system permease protein
VRAFGIAPYLLPGPLVIARTLVENWRTLAGSWWITMSIALAALAAAVVLGVALAVLFSASKWVERSFFPYAVILQVTPIVAIAPLIIVWVNDVRLSLLICAWIVAFFPILSNTTLGLNSADPNLVDLFKLYGAGRWQRLAYLRAVVAEFVAGTGGAQSGLAWRILEAGYQLQVPRMFAALALISLSGVLLFLALSLLSHLCLRRWHESELGDDT